MINAGCAPPRGRELGRPKRINKEMPEAVRFPSLGRWFRNDRFAPPCSPFSGIANDPESCRLYSRCGISDAGGVSGSVIEKQTYT